MPTRTNFRPRFIPFLLLGALSGACSSAEGTAGDDAASSPRDERKPDPATTWRPSDDGSVDDSGYATFVLDPYGAHPVVLRTLVENVTRHPNGYDLAGTVLVSVPGSDPVTLLDAVVALDRGPSLGLERFAGTVSLDAVELGAWSGLELSALRLTNARLGADEDGLFVGGALGGRLTPDVELSGDVDAEASFGGDPDDWALALAGRLVVGGVELSEDARAVLDRDGLSIEGFVTTAESRIAVSGSAGPGEVALHGGAPVTIAVVDGKTVTQRVTDARLCGVDVFTDAAVCGTTTVTDAGRCGTEVVTDRAVCGTTQIRDAVRCGTTNAENAAECGTISVTNAAICGWDTYTDAAHCGSSCGFWGSCECQVARTCQTAARCTYPNSCEVAATCELPKRCEVPATCERARTCDRGVVVPAFEYGVFRGRAELEVGTDGLEGSVSGEYCATGGDCAPPDAARLIVSDGGLEACVTVSEHGEFCAGF